MIDDMYDVMNRINEIKKRFAGLTSRSKTEQKFVKLPFKQQVNRQIHATEAAGMQENKLRIRDTSFADKLLNSVEIENTIKRSIANQQQEGTGLLQGVQTGPVVPKNKILDILKEIVRDANSQDKHE